MAREFSCSTAQVAAFNATRLLSALPGTAGACGTRSTASFGWGAADNGAFAAPKGRNNVCCDLTFATTSPRLGGAWACFCWTGGEEARAERKLSLRPSGGSAAARQEQI